MWPCSTGVGRCVRLEEHVSYILGDFRSFVVDGMPYKPWLSRTDFLVDYRQEEPREIQLRSVNMEEHDISGVVGRGWTQ